MVRVIAKPTYLDAEHHQGTLESAESISMWLIGMDCQHVTIINNDHIQFEDTITVGRQLVFKGWWVIRLEDRRVVSMSDREFRTRFNIFPWETV